MSIKVVKEEKKQEGANKKIVLNISGRKGSQKKRSPWLTMIICRRSRRTKSIYDTATERVRLKRRTSITSRTIASFPDSLNSQHFVRIARTLFGKFSLLFFFFNPKNFHTFIVFYRGHGSLSLISS